MQRLWPQRLLGTATRTQIPFPNKLFSAYCGFLAAIIFWTGVIVVGLMQPEYQPLADTVSKMGRVGRPFAIALNGILIVTGLLIAVFALGLPASEKFFRRSTRDYFVVFGFVGLAGAGLLPCDEICAGNSLANIVHTLPVAIGFTSLQLALLRIANSHKRDYFWAGIPKSSLTTFWAGTLALIVFMLGRWQFVPLLDSYAGLSEKIYLAFLFLFVFTLAKRLYLQSQASTPL